MARVGRVPFHTTMQGKAFIEDARNLKRDIAGMRYRGTIESALISAGGAANVAGIRGAALQTIQRKSDVAAGERLTKQIAGQKDIAGIRGEHAYQRAELPGQQEKYFEHYGGRGSAQPIGDLGSALADVLGGGQSPEARTEGIMASPTKRKRRFPRPGATPLEELRDLDNLMD